MKSAYELAMERLEKEKPSGAPLSDDQKKQIAEINEKYEAQIAQAKIMADQKMAQAGGDPAVIEQIKATLAEDIMKLEEERDSKKQKIRNT